MGIFKLRGFALHLSNEERYTLEHVQQLVCHLDPQAACVFIYQHEEIKLHAIRFSQSKKEVQFLFKKVVKI